MSETIKTTITNILTGETKVTSYGHSLSEETKRKIGDAHRGKISPMKGKHHTEGTKIKIKEARSRQIMKPRSTETKTKISIANTGKVRSEEQIENIKRTHKGMLGLNHSNITKSRMRRAWENRPHSVPDEIKLKISIRTKEGMRKEGVIEKLRIARAKQNPTWISVQEYEIREQLDRQGISHKPDSCVKGLLSPPYQYHRWDIVIEERKILIEVQGCYWHNCPKCFPNNIPKDHRILDNVKRDLIIITEARAKGWKVIEIWEHTIKESEIQFKL